MVTATGAKNRYNLTNALPTGLTYYFLTQRLDRYGRVLETLNYDTSGGMTRLKSVVDMDGKTNTFAYNYPDPNYEYLITSVTDPYGNSTQFGYDTSNGYGTMTAMVDAANMTNTFAFDSSDFIYSMTTPYGITDFTFFSGTNYDGTIRRSMDIQEPNGQHQLYAYCDLGPHTPFLDGACDACRNSYHWNRAQYQLIPSSDLTNELSMPTNDYELAEAKHWLHGPNDQVGKTVSDTMNAIAPATDASGNREPTWYYYEGQTNLVFTGTLKVVTNILIATYSAVSLTRSAIGRPTSITYENYTPGYSQTLSTYNNYYDSSGTVLQTVRGPHNELVRGYGFSVTGQIVVVRMAELASQGFC